jgi:hypothetical protein
MDERDKAEQDFKKQFNDYDQTVDVVSCWHFLSDTIFRKSYFFRFGKFRTKDNAELTPDFAVAESKDGSEGDPGCIVCDVKKLPNPHPESTDAAQREAAYKIFGKKIEEVFKYGTSLIYASDFDGLPKLAFNKHEVVLLTPEETVDSAYKYLEAKLGPKRFDVGRPLVLVSYVYSGSDQLECYMFKWKQGELNSPFSHPILADRMVAKNQPIKVFPKHFLNYKVRHIVCNDSPPSIYLIVYIWVEVLMKFLTPEEIELWQSVGSTRTREIELTVEQLHRKLCDEYSAPFGMRDVRRALNTLCEIKRAVLKDKSKELYAIHFYNLASRGPKAEPGEQDGVPDRARQREYGRIFAQLLAKKEVAPLPTRRRIGFRRSKASPNNLMLPFPE